MNFIKCLLAFDFLENIRVGSRLTHASVIDLDNNLDFVDKVFLLSIWLEFRSDVGVSRGTSVSIPGHVCHGAWYLVSSGTWSQRTIVTPSLLSANAIGGPSFLIRTSLNECRLVIGTRSRHLHHRALIILRSHGELWHFFLRLLVVWLVVASTWNVPSLVHVGSN